MTIEDENFDEELARSEAAKLVGVPNLTQSKYPDEVVYFAMRLYFKGYHSPTIANEIKEQFGYDINRIVVQGWIKRLKWDEIKREAQVDSLVKIAEEEKVDALQKAKEHAETYRGVWEKGKEALEEHLNFDKASEAVQAIDIGIKGERKVMAGLISLQFLQEIVNIIGEEVRDEEARHRISVRFKQLVANIAEN